MQHCGPSPAATSSAMQATPRAAPPPLTPISWEGRDVPPQPCVQHRPSLRCGCVGRQRQAFPTCMPKLSAAAAFPLLPPCLMCVSNANAVPGLGVLRVHDRLVYISWEGTTTPNMRARFQRPHEARVNTRRSTHCREAVHPYRISNSLAAAQQDNAVQFESGDSRARGGARGPGLAAMRLPALPPAQHTRGDA